MHNEEPSKCELIDPDDGRGLAERHKVIQKKRQTEHPAFKELLETAYDIEGIKVHILEVDSNLEGTMEFHQGTEKILVSYKKIICSEEGEHCSKYF